MKDNFEFGRNNTMFKFGRGYIESNITNFSDCFRNCTSISTIPDSFVDWGDGTFDIIREISKPRRYGTFYIEHDIIIER